MAETGVYNEIKTMEFPRRDIFNPHIPFSSDRGNVKFVVLGENIVIRSISVGIFIPPSVIKLLFLHAY